VAAPVDCATQVRDIPLAADEPGVPSTDICDASTVIGWLGDVAPAMWPVTDWLVVLVVDR
jgi:hypothetical protein